MEKWKKILDNHGYAGTIITDLSKAFDIINHELLNAKLHAYGFGNSALMLINSYLKNRWHTTKINSAYSTWKELIVGVPQGSVHYYLIFILMIYFLSLKKLNQLIVRMIPIYMHVIWTWKLECDAHMAIEWFECNYMMLNSDKCHFIVAGNKHEYLWVNVGHSKSWETASEKILTALARMSHILKFSKMRILIKSFVDSQFSYCPLIWMFCSRSLNNKINKAQERTLRILYKDYDSSVEDLLEKDNSDKIRGRNIKLLSKEVYKK